MKPTLRQLEYVVAVADALSFRRAAEACLVSQPGLSAQIGELEKILGVRLFERDRRTVLVTPAGQQVASAARRILAEVDDLVEIARRSRDPLAGDLRLGVSPTVAPYLLPAAMPAIHERYPRLRLLLREEQTRRLVEMAAGGELDLLLLALEADLGDLERAPLFRDRFVVALPEEHPLARRKRVSISDLRDEQVLLLDDGHCLRGQTVPICEEAGACEVGDFRATSLHTLLHMVSTGIGITLLPEMAAGDELHGKPGLTVRRFRDPQPARTVGLAWRSSSPAKEAFAELGELFRRAAR